MSKAQQIFEKMNRYKTGAFSRDAMHELHPAVKTALLVAGAAAGTALIAPHIAAHMGGGPHGAGLEHPEPGGTSGFDMIAKTAHGGPGPNVYHGPGTHGGTGRVGRLAGTNMGTGPLISKTVNPVTQTDVTPAPPAAADITTAPKETGVAGGRAGGYAHRQQSIQQMAKGAGETTEFQPVKELEPKLGGGPARRGTTEYELVKGSGAHGGQQAEPIDIKPGKPGEIVQQPFVPNTPGLPRGMTPELAAKIRGMKLGK